MNLFHNEQTLLSAGLLRAAAFTCIFTPVLFGCAVTNQQTTASLYLPNIDVAAKWSGGLEASPTNSKSELSQERLAQWWLYFNDPLLGTLIVDALKSNTSIVSAQAALQQARAQRDISAASLLPSLGSSLTAQRSKSDSGSNNNFKAGLDASWEIDVFGANRSALTASEATAKASAASLANVQVSVAAEVALNYISYRNAQARLAIAKNNLASQLDTNQITNWRLQAGLVTSLEAEQSRASVEQIRAQLPVLQTSMTQTGYAIAVLTGKTPTALASVLGTVAPIPQTSGDVALSFPAETLRQRPDVQASELQVTAASARVFQANAALLPSFNLGGSLGLSALTLGALTNGASLASSLLASISLPLFDGGAGRAQVQAQEAALEQARMAYKSTVLTALKEVEDALVALNGDRQRLTSLQAAAEAASNAALLATQRYTSGLIDFQTVLETQRAQLNTQDSVASTMADVSADYVRLYKTLGGGWQPDTHEAATAPAKNVFRTPNL